MKLVIVGGVAGGATAATRVRRFTSPAPSLRNKTCIICCRVSLHGMAGVCGRDGWMPPEVNGADLA